MKRLLTIAKYVPALLCGLLVVAWVVSWFAAFGATIRWPNGRLGGTYFGCSGGSTNIYHQSKVKSSELYARAIDINWDNLLGEFRYVYFQTQSISIACPIPFLLTLFLPLSIGPFIRYRYPLWSYFAFIALLSVQLAYYMR